MDIRSMQGGPREWLFAARIDRNLRLADGFQYASGIPGRVLQRSIAMNSRNTKKIQIRMVSSKQNCERILNLSSMISALHINMDLETSLHRGLRKSVSFFFLT